MSFLLFFAYTVHRGQDERVSVCSSFPISNHSELSYVEYRQLENGALSMYRWGEAERWLVIEGLLPLLGAGVLYLIWGLALYMGRSAAQKVVPFDYSWKEWIDPLGWLYGAAILAVQAGTSSLHGGGSSVLTFFCFGAGFASVLFLLAAMTNRGQHQPGQPDWEPPFSLTVTAALLVVAVLTAGYKAYAAPHPH